MLVEFVDIASDLHCLIYSCDISNWLRKRASPNLHWNWLWEVHAGHKVSKCLFAKGQLLSFTNNF